MVKINCTFRLFSISLYREDSSVQHPVLEGERMNRNLKAIHDKRKKVATIRKRAWDRRALIKCVGIVTACACSPFARAQSAAPAQAPLTFESPQELLVRISKLEAEVSELKAIVNRIQSVPSSTNAAAAAQPAAVIQPTPKKEAVQTVLQPDESRVLGFLRETTINVALDGYYAYNFNNPVGRVNLLRAYDVLSNEFSLNQASVVVEHPPDAQPAAAGAGVWTCSSAKPPTHCKETPPTNPGPRFIATFFRPTAHT